MPYRTPFTSSRSWAQRKRSPAYYLCGALFAALVAVACSGGGAKPNSCLAGQTIPCACLGGEMTGIQTCQADGKSLSECLCPEDPAGSGGSGGAPTGTGGSAPTASNSGTAQGTGGTGGATGHAGGFGGHSQGAGGTLSTGGFGGQSTASAGGSSQLSCEQQAPNPATGQGCPLFSPCQNHTTCGMNQGCQQWFCNQGRCALNPLSNCGKTAGGNCQADIELTHHYEPPVEKDFLAPDGVNFRELGALVFTVTNNTPDTLYLKQVPLSIEVAGGGSKFDVDALKMFWDSGGADHQPGDLLVCSEPKPFSFPASGKLSTGCGSSPHTDIPPNGGSKRFLINIAFEKTKTNIAGRSYRLTMPNSTDLLFTVGKNGPLFTKTVCGLSSQGFVGPWLYAK